jgi:serine/threonine protein kinase
MQTVSVLNIISSDIAITCIAIDRYMAPERIDPRKQGRQGYDIRSDVWSLGITMSELSIGKFPYPEVPGNFFLQIKQVCEDEPPRLPEDTDRFSPEYRNFIVQCLQKEYDKRPNYSTLMQHPIIVKYKDEDISAYAAKVLNSEST